MNLGHRSVMDRGDGWFKFQSEGLNTLDEIIPPDSGYLIDSLTFEGIANDGSDIFTVHYSKIQGRERTVTVNGREIDVLVQNDSGYDPDTNSHEIDWCCKDSRIVLTEVECDQIHMYLTENSDDERFDDDDVI